VKVERLVGSLKLDPVPFFLQDAMSLVESRITDGSGSVTFHETGKKFMVNPQSKNQAYVTATLSGAKVCYPAECREISVPRAGKVVAIPLPSGGTPSASGGLEHPAAASPRDENRYLGSGTLEHPRQPFGQDSLFQ
jgi:hypothetical protein